MAKTILLLTYYFEPCNYVAANRPSTLAKELINNGYRVVVVTRHWSGSEKYWDDYLATSDKEVEIEKESDGLTVHRLPYSAKMLSNNLMLRKLQLLSNFCTGSFHNELNYSQYKPYIEGLIKSQHFDLVLVSSPPLNIVKLAYQLKLKYHLNYMVDIRDFQNNVVLNKISSVSVRNKFIHFCIMRYVKIWFKHADLVFTVTPPFTSFIQQNANPSAITVMNGYSEKLLTINEKPFDRFHISYVGTLYNNNELKILLNGLKALFEQAFSKHIILNFVGTKANRDVAEEIVKIIPSANLIMQDRIPQEVAQNQAARSQVLLVLGYRSMKGVFGTKIFEYLGLRKPIILFPSDKGPMQEIMAHAKCGISAETAEDFVGAVRKYYNEWNESGDIQFEGNLDYIKQYSRENQYKKLLPYLEKI